MYVWQVKQQLMLLLELQRLCCARAELMQCVLHVCYRHVLQLRL
jgi:hypothetical protein